jgi:hypothetical protein
MDEHLAPFADHLRAPTSWFGDLGRYWGASYFVLARLATAHPDWRWVSHESLCADPTRGFTALLAGLPTDPQALTAFLQDHDREPTVDETPYAPFRSAATEAAKWHGILTSDQAREVLAGAEPFGDPCPPWPDPRL